MPVPTPQGEYSIWTSRGFPMDAGTLAGLFKYHADQRRGGRRTCRWIRCATRNTTPGTFSPQCGLTGTIVLRGGGCKNELGWYNATEPRHAAARQPDLHAGAGQPAGGAAQRPDVRGQRLLPAGHAYHDAGAPALVGRTYDFAPNIRTSPNYQGGLIGLAMKGARGQPVHADQIFAGGAERQERRGQAVGDDAHLPVGRGSAGVLHRLRGPADLRDELEGLQHRQTNDGDFNDFVFYVTGLSCNLGGDAVHGSERDGDLRGRHHRVRRGRDDHDLPPGRHAVRREVRQQRQRLQRRWSTRATLCPVDEVCARASAGTPATTASSRARSA